MRKAEPILEVAIDLLKKQIEDMEAFRRQHERRCTTSYACVNKRPERKCKTKTEMIRMQTEEMARFTGEAQKNNPREGA